MNNTVEMQAANDGSMSVDMSARVSHPQTIWMVHVSVALQPVIICINDHLLGQRRVAIYQQDPWWSRNLQPVLQVGWQQTLTKIDTFCHAMTLSYHGMVLHCGEHATPTLLYHKIHT